MIHPDELIVDNFAGGGGTSTGIEMALGRSADIAIDHDPEAIAMHAANHPATRHLCENVWQIDPREACRGRPVGLAWFSPDCKHFSKAKGGRPVDRNIRGLAWVALKWAGLARPRVIILENVEEFQTWGPLAGDRPCPRRKGMTFRRWVGQLRDLGYQVEWRELRACNYGAPTTRKRLFVVARCDGQPIVWPQPTQAACGDLMLRPYRTAAECIDWSTPCPSIFGRKKPLAEATMRRIANGVRRYVIESAEPFIVPITHSGDGRVHGLGEPLRTVTTAHRGELALITPYFVPRYGERDGQVPRCQPADTPMATIVPTANGSPLTAPMPTIQAGGWHLGEVRAFLLKYYGEGGQDQDCRDPLHTIPSKARFGLVTVAGEEWQIVDIGMRTLSPRELFRAQGFPDSYVIDPVVNGKPLTKTAQIRMCGNSVCPPIAAALVRAQFGTSQAESEAA